MTKNKLAKVSHPSGATQHSLASTPASFIWPADLPTLFSYSIFYVESPYIKELAKANNSTYIAPPSQLNG